MYSFCPEDLSFKAVICPQGHRDTFVTMIQWTWQHRYILSDNFIPVPGSALPWSDPVKTTLLCLSRVLSFSGQPVNVSAVGLWHMDQHGWAQSGHQSADKDPRGRGWFSLPGGEFLSCLMLWIFQSAASNSSVSGTVVLPPPHSSFTLLRERYGNRLSVAITSCFWRQALCSLHSTGFNIVQ